MNLDTKFGCGLFGSRFQQLLRPLLLLLSLILRGHLLFDTTCQEPHLQRPLIGLRCSFVSLYQTWGFDTTELNHSRLSYLQSRAPFLILSCHHTCIAITGQAPLITQSHSSLICLVSSRLSIIAYLASL